MDWTFYFNVAGLILVTVGSGILAASSYLSDKELEQSWTLAFDGGEAQKAFWRKTRGKIRLGLSLLVLGSFLQFAGLLIGKLAPR